MFKTIALIFMLSSTAHAFTLNNNFGASFKDNKVKVYIDKDTACNGVNIDDLNDMVKSAVDNFWNEIPTSALVLKASGFSAPILTMNEGRLCSPTDDTCISQGTIDGNNNPLEGLIPAVQDIIIACNTNPKNFGTGVIAVTVPNNFSGKKIAGAVILINDSGTFGNLSRNDQIAVLAHEMGHALGLGHSEDDAALMYYRTIDLRSNLGQDDIDGISYLYPMHVDAFGLFGGFCGTISDNKTPPGDSPFLPMVITLGSFILILELVKLLRRPKARSAA
jgi:hypothetical protein